MNKRILLLLLILAISLQGLFALSFYYAAAGEGRKLEESHYAGLTLSAGVSFFDQGYLALDADVTLSPMFESVAVNLSTAPFSLPVRATSLFPNKVLYSPKLRVGAEYAYHDGWYYKAELALINFRYIDFEYEFFTPIILVDSITFGIGYGIRLIKASYYI